MEFMYYWDGCDLGEVGLDATWEGVIGCSCLRNSALGLLGGIFPVVWEPPGYTVILMA